MEAVTKYRRWQLGLAAALATVLSAGSVSLAEAADPAVARTADGLASKMWPGVRQSNGTELARVHIADQGGRDLDGAVVVASLWPTREERSRMKVGDKWSLVPIDRVPVVGGSAVIRSADSLLSGHISANGTLKVHLDLFTNEGLTTVLMVERVKDTTGRWVDSSVLNAPTPEALAPVRFQLDASRMAKLDLGTKPAEMPAEVRDHQGATCSGYEYAGLYSAYETVAATAVYKGIKADVTYTSSASTTSGLGVKLGGGAWTQNGTATATSTLTASFVQVVGSTTSWTNKEYRATWAHHRDYRHCIDPNDVTWPYDDTWITQYFTEPYKVVGFPAIINSRYALPGCHTQHALTGVANVSTDTYGAATYGSAFAITWGGATFYGSAKSGYTSSVKIKFTNPTPGTYWYWCGENYVPHDSQRLRAGR